VFARGDVLTMTKKRQILLQNALALLFEAQRQATNLKDDTQEEIKEMMGKLSAQTKEGVAGLLQAWHENKEHLPEKLTSEMDRLLDKVGLVRKSKAKAAEKKTAEKKATAPKK
jgi:polyhydroxyalkanoate synthesis regulator phasin